MIVKTINLNSENYNEMINLKEYCFVDIWAPWCGPCKELSPIIDELSGEVPPNIQFCKLDADSNMEICKSLNVRNIPTIILYKAGEIIERSTGFKSKPKSEIKRDILAMIPNNQ